MQIKRTDAADEDLIDIYLYGSQNFGQSKAESYYAEINQTFLFLADNPLASPESFEFEPPVRIHAHGTRTFSRLHANTSGLQSDYRCFLANRFRSFGLKDLLRPFFNFFGSSLTNLCLHILTYCAKL